MNNKSTGIFLLPLIQEEQLSVKQLSVTGGRMCTKLLSTGKLPRRLAQEQYG